MHRLPYPPRTALAYPGTSIITGSENAGIAWRMQKATAKMQ